MRFLCRSILMLCLGQHDIHDAEGEQCREDVCAFCVLYGVILAGNRRLKAELNRVGIGDIDIEQAVVKI